MAADLKRSRTSRTRSEVSGLRTGASIVLMESAVVECTLRMLVCGAILKAEALDVSANAARA